MTPRPACPGRSCPPQTDAGPPLVFTESDAARLLTELDAVLASRPS